jgi:hypothetical protein
MVSRFGTWSVNEVDKTYTVRIEGALNQTLEGREFKGSVVSVNGNEMKATDPEGHISTYRRIAAQPTLRQQLVGTWAYDSNTSPLASPAVGSTPKGYLILRG